MKFLFTIALLALIGCAGNKSATSENPKCKELMTAIPEALEANKMPTNIWVKEEKCEPIETIICNNIEYGIIYKCQSMDKPISIFN